MTDSNSPSIHLLPDSVVRKIAAGEVVERPASVVKELVENAIDAGANRISVEVEKGGIALLAISDNGHGIRPQELPLALKRHATSKISGEEDLFRLNTLGFRGEALPSISSISRFRIESATEESDPLGYAVEVNNGQPSGLKEVPMTRGTRVTVKELFYNTPARQKFLKRPETEWGHVYDLLTAMALHELSIEWRLTHNGKVAFSCPSTKDLKVRVLDLLGEETASALYPVERDVAGIRISGLLSHPNFSRKSTRQYFVFVNGRYIQDRVINHAIMTGYRGLLMTQQYPMIILHLQLDPQHVDVNVHPSKREVRFSNSQAIHQLISETFRRRLEEAPWKKTGSSLPELENDHAVEGQEQSVSYSMATSRAASTLEEPKGAAYQSNIYQALQDFRSRTLPEFREAGPQAQVGTFAFSSLNLIGQFHATYLVCEKDGCLVLIDQHAAHERIGFEQLKSSYLAGKIPQQILLQPQTFDLSPLEASRLSACLQELGKFGFDVDLFGEQSFALKAHPSLLNHCDLVTLLKELSSQLQDEGGLEPLQDRFEHILATMACHRQIRANHYLAREEMQNLLDQLEGTPRSYHCPHGRPVMVEVESREIEKWFKRVV